MAILKRAWVVAAAGIAAVGVAFALLTMAQRDFTAAVIGEARAADAQAPTPTAYDDSGFRLGEAPLNASERAGREIWYKATAGNARFHTYVFQQRVGVIPAHLSELSPDSVRGFLPGFGYQCGVFFSSSVVYVEAVFAKQHTYAVVMAMTAATVFLLAAAITAAGRERKGTTFGA